MKPTHVNAWDLRPGDLINKTGWQHCYIVFTKSIKDRDWMQFCLLSSSGCIVSSWMVGPDETIMAVRKPER